MNTFTLGACFQHELHTGPHLLPDYKPIITFLRSTAFCFPAYAACRRVHCRVIHWSSDSFHCSYSTVLHSMIKMVDLPYNNGDQLICFYLKKQIYDRIEYTTVTLCNATIGLFSATIGLKHQHLKCEKHIYRWRAFESIQSELLKKDQSGHSNL